MDTNSEVFEEALDDLVDNINSLNATIKSEDKRCPDCYPKDYALIYSEIAALLTKENILKLINEQKKV